MPKIMSSVTFTIFGIQQSRPRSIMLLSPHNQSVRNKLLKTFLYFL